MSYLWLYGTVFVVTGLRYLLEYRYYRSHNAIPSTLQFVILPYSVLLTGSILSHIVNLYHIIYLSINLFIHLTFILNLLSLSMIIPLLLLHWIFSRLHSKRWLGFAVNRKLFSSRKVPYAVHTIITILLGYIVYLQSVIDAISAIFIIEWIYHTVKYYIRPLFHKRQDQSRGRIQTRRSTSDRLYEPYQPRYIREGDTSSRSNRSTTTSTTPASSTNRRPSRRDIPTTPRGGVRRVSTEYRRGRSIPASGRKKRSKSTVTVDPGRELFTPSSSVTYVDTPSKFLPHAHITQSDLSCIICYEDIKSNDGAIILCPHCKFPSHEAEFLSWMQVSNLCPRCSKEISRKEIKSPSYRLDAKEYVKLLRDLPK